MLPQSDQNQPSSLSGKKIVVSAEELELKEHRGIASYAKAILKGLKEEGAEVWLLTQCNPNIFEQGLRWLPTSTRNLIHTSIVLDSLAEGQRDQQFSTLEKKLDWARKARKAWTKIRLLIELLLTPLFRETPIKKIDLRRQFDNPYLRKERLKYLENVDGILCARNIFKRSLWMSTLRYSRPITINLKGFDALIITSPQNIYSKGIKNTIQTIHDLIPLEEGHVSTEYMISFTRRLQLCNQSNKIFVSRSTSKKFNRYVGSNKYFKNKIVIQPPSLDFPSWIVKPSNESCDLNPTFKALRDENYLKPFKYMLFNSSIDPRKNILFLVKAYQESDLHSQGIKLCITGQLKSNTYSEELRKVVQNDPGIVITGYVNENEKVDLYLNAMSLLSPSLVEGFGIPVLDSACLGMTTLASDSDSHLEIKSLKDFCDWIIIARTLQTQDWAIAMNAIAFQARNLEQDPFSERSKRISRYQRLKNEIKNQFIIDIREIITSKSERVN